MEILIGSIIVLFVLLIVGTWIASKIKRGKQTEPEEPTREVPLDCCGGHEICEFEKLINQPQEIIYFDDEELDRFKGKSPTSYADDEIDEIREILYSIQPKEISLWLKSIELRKIKLPAILQQESRLLIADALKTS